MKFLANGLNKSGALILIGCLVGFASCSDDDEVCTESTWYEDADGNGLGNPDASLDACEQPEGFVANSDDDNELCTELSWYEDADGDGLGNPDASLDACEQPEGFVANSDDDHDTGIEFINLLGDGTVPEGITINQSNGDIYVGGILSNDIQKAVNGEAAYFKTSGEDGLNAITGMTVDEVNNRLWVCSPNLMDNMTSQLFVFDLNSGEVLQRFDSPDSGSRHYFNDVIVDASGKAYITDSGSPIIWTVDSALTSLTLFVTDPDFTQAGSTTGNSLNGITISPDSQYLIAATLLLLDEEEGRFFRISLADGTVNQVNVTANGTGFFGGDGIVFYENDGMYFINNDGIYDAQFSNDFLEATVSKISFEGESTALDGSSTTPDIYEDRIYVVNSQSDHFVQFYPDFGTPHDTPFTVTSIPLELLQ